VPKGAVTIIYGPESSGKTILALKAIANHQRLYPDKVCVFFDVEHAYDPKWSGLLGVDKAKLAVIQPTYAEQIVDMVEGLVAADDIGLIVVDSLAAMATARELQSSADKANVGGSSLAIGSLMRKTNAGLSRAATEGRSPTLIFVNQLRYKIGIIFGSPETMPGGMAPKHWSFLTVRLWGKNISDTKINAFRPVKKHCTSILQKWKVPIVQVTSEWDVVTYPHGGWEIGDVDDWSVVREQLERRNLFEKQSGSKWLIDGETYPTIKAFRERLDTEDGYVQTMKSNLIELAMIEANGEML